MRRQGAADRAPPPAFSWTGFYIGANIGGADGPRIQRQLGIRTAIPGFMAYWRQHAVIPTVFPGQLASLAGSGGSSGVIGGGQIGYNWQVKQFVLGVEADLVKART